MAVLEPQLYLDPAGSSPAGPYPFLGPAGSNSTKFNELWVRAVAGAGIETYNLVKISELYNEEKQDKEKGYKINYPGLY